MANDDNNPKGDSFLAYLGKYIMVPVLVAVVTSVSTAYITAKLSRDNDRDQRRWELKREAGLRALQIIDQYYADHAALGHISNSLKPNYQFKPMNLEEVREVCNELVVNYEHTNAVTTYLDILSLGQYEGEKSISLGRIQDLRNDIRKELYSEPEMNLNPNMLWINDLFHSETNLSVPKSN